MISVIAPTLDVNSDSGTIIAWHKADRDEVKCGDRLAELETSKAIIEVESPGEGFLLRAAPENVEIPLTAPVAFLFDDLASLEAHQKEQVNSKTHETRVRATVKAQLLAKQHSVSLEKLDQGRLITTKEVEQAITEARLVEMDTMPDLLVAKVGIERVLLFGGGLGATQIIDIFRNDSKREAIAIVDDTRSKWGTTVYDVPIIGGFDRLESLFHEKAFDSALCAITTSISVRTNFREVCRELGIPMANAIDKTARFSADVEMGSGNVICAFCHFGTSAKIGDGNFISAYNSYDHHCELGNDISTGPGVMSSGKVKIRDRVRMGTGIFIEPYVEVGVGVVVASGSVLVRSVPAGHIVKAKSGQMAIVPASK